MVDRKFCASSYLMYRTMADPNRCFSSELQLNLYKPTQAKKAKFILKMIWEMH